MERGGHVMAIRTDESQAELKCGTNDSPKDQVETEYIISGVEPSILDIYKTYLF